MRLSLDLPRDATEWSEAGRPHVSIAAAPWLRVEVDRPVIAPDDARDWVRDVLHRDSRRAGRVLGAIRGRSLHGWPIEIVLVAITVNGRVSELRLVGLYDMLGYVAAVTLRATDVAQFRDAFQALFILVASARPRWRTRNPVALVELWSLAVTPPNG